MSVNEEQARHAQMGKVCLFPSSSRTLIKSKHVYEWLMTSTSRLLLANRSRGTRDVSRLITSDTKSTRATIYIRNLVHLSSCISDSMTCFYDCHLKARKNRAQAVNEAHHIRSELVNKLLSFAFFKSLDMIIK